MRKSINCGILILFCAVAALFAGCDILGGNVDKWREKARQENKISTESNPIPLAANTWTDGNITSSNRDGLWYSFNVTSETAYYVWWNDRDDGDNTKTANIRVSASYSNGTSIFTGYSAWYNPQQFTANTSGTVKVKVEHSGYIGTFAVAYSTSNQRP